MKNKAGRVGNFHIDLQTGTVHKVNIQSEFTPRFEKDRKEKGRGDSLQKKMT